MKMEMNWNGVELSVTLFILLRIALLYDRLSTLTYPIFTSPNRNPNLTYLEGPRAAAPGPEEGLGGGEGRGSQEQPQRCYRTHTAPLDTMHYSTH